MLDLPGHGVENKNNASIYHVPFIPCEVVEDIRNEVPGEEFGLKGVKQRGRKVGFLWGVFPEGVEEFEFIGGSTIEGLGGGLGRCLTRRAEDGC